MHNRFRSKLGESLFIHYNRNKSIHTKSAGVMLDVLFPYVAPAVKEALSKKGVKLASEMPVQLTPQAIKWADKIIVVADNVDPNVFPKEKTIIWKIKDTDQDNKEEIMDRLLKIESKVKDFIEHL